MWVGRSRKRSRREGASAGETLALPVSESSTRNNDVGGWEESGGSSSGSMGVGISACKGMVHPNTVDPNGEEERSLSTVTRLPFLSAFEDRAPFKPSGTLSDKDESLLKALTHHRTPFAVIETDSPELNIIYASGGCVAGLGMPAENIEGSSLEAVLKKGIQALPEDVERLSAAVRAKEVGVIFWHFFPFIFFSKTTQQYLSRLVPLTSCPFSSRRPIVGGNTKRDGLAPAGSWFMVVFCRPNCRYSSVFSRPKK